MKGIGISGQQHGFVPVDKKGKVNPVSELQSSTNRPQGLSAESRGHGSKHEKPPVAESTN